MAGSVTSAGAVAAQAVTMLLLLSHVWTPWLTPCYVLLLWPACRHAQLQRAPQTHPRQSQQPVLRQMTPHPLDAGQQQLSRLDPRACLDSSRTCGLQLGMLTGGGSSSSSSNRCSSGALAACAGR
jgi:hypothetical protein